MISQTQLTDHLWIINVMSEGSAGFLAGQYQTLSTESGDKLGPFSIVSTTNDLPIVTFCTRHALPLADRSKFFLHKSKGQMTAPDDSKTYVFCAGGTGITPFLSLMQAYPKRSFHCYWSLKNLEDIALIKYFKVKHNIQEHHYLGDADLDLTRYLVDHVQERNIVFYLAGPFVFINKLGDWLLEQGIPADHILSDMKKFTAG